MADQVYSERKKYLYSEIVERIQEMIRNGDFKVDERIPPERTLAEIFRVSRNCIRQAVQALAERNVLESRQGDGTYVRAVDQSFFTKHFALAIQAQKETLRDIFEFRQLLEPQIAWLAAKHITAKELDRLKVIVCDQQRKSLAGEEDADLDAAFHMQLVLATKNRIIQQVVNTMNEILNESRNESLRSKARREASINGHFKIIDAMEKKDCEMALQAMKEHLLAVEQLVLAPDGK